MKHVVVFAHPRSGSFIRQAAGAYVDELEQYGHTVEVRDLYTIGFNPVLSEEELAGKGPVPGRKQVFRRHGPEGRIEADRLSTLDSDEEGLPLLVPVMRGGRRVVALPGLQAIRAHAAAELASLPEALSHRTSGPPLHVEIAPLPERLAREADRRVDTA